MATHPDPRHRDAGRAVAWAQRAVDLDPDEGNYRNTLGAAHYRAGQWNDAIEALTKAMTLLDARWESFNTFFLAMAHWQLGHQEEARQWYDRAVQWMKKHKPNDEELRRFRTEAAALLGIGDSARSGKEKGPR
jgi:Flp pilus assembly protein TadD